MQKIIRGSFTDMANKLKILSQKKFNNVLSDKERYITNRSFKLKKDEHIIVLNDVGMAVYNKSNLKKLKEQYAKIEKIQKELIDKGHNIPENKIVKPPVIFFEKDLEDENKLSKKDMKQIKSVLKAVVPNYKPQGNEIQDTFNELRKIMKNYESSNIEIVGNSNSPLTWDDVVENGVTVKDYKKIKKSDETLILLEPQMYNTIDLYTANDLNALFDLDESIKKKELKNDDPIFKNTYVKLNSKLINKIKKHMNELHKKSPDSKNMISKTKTKSKLAPCPESMERNQKGNCVVTMATPCKEGKKRNPETKRCRKEKK